MENHRTSLDAVVRLIKFISQTFDDGLAILTGTTQPPTTQDITRRLHPGHGGASVLSTAERYGTRTTGGERVPRAQILLENEYEATVTALGGWCFLNEAICSFRSEYPESWLLFEQWSLFVRRGGIIHTGKGGMACYINVHRKDYVDVRTQRRRLDKIIRVIGLYVLTRGKK